MAGDRKQNGVKGRLGQREKRRGKREAKKSQRDSVLFGRC